eukprot:CAMPEP_0184501478 /NCGR_PEP_ID=MMETSP0113_2-20130426/47811_1 /TAXON_ID=91329 /ORGANISM="Norrisiella sphaerica, Strain BC52" /LENGTH=502 /DNA_ID=CAMNT_0026890263 /DNA_START=17 /DNA_END=1522 /DNA_ORIENTATION=+
MSDRKIVVESVHTDENGVEKTVQDEADLVLVTVSLGVLKSGMVRFVPSLPPWKQNSIQRLGFGLINKLVLEWREEDMFWRKEDMFGHVKESEEDRGNNYMFWNLKNVTGKPILVSIFAGRAAVKFEDVPLEDLVNEAMVHLRKIYGDHIPEPIRTFKTSWKKDPFARGTYSYIGVGGSGRDYDALARPVGRKLFFAGEATCRLYPATVPGAYASGLFAAGQIAQACKPVKFEFAKLSSDSLYKEFEQTGVYKVGERVRRGVRGFRRKENKAENNFLKKKLKQKEDSFILDLMDGKIEVDTGYKQKLEELKSRKHASTDSPINLDYTSDESDELEQGNNLPEIQAFTHRKRDELDDNGVADMTEMLLSKKNRKRRHEERHRARLQKKIKEKMRKKMKKKQQKKEEDEENKITKTPFEGKENDSRGVEVPSYIRQQLLKILTHYTEKFKIPNSVKDSILDKSVDKVMKDWNSKSRTVSVKTWMRNEKRKKSVKILISKYSKKHA